MSTIKYLCALFNQCNQAPAPTSDGVCAAAFHNGDVRFTAAGPEKKTSLTHLSFGQKIIYQKNVDFFPNV